MDEATFVKTFLNSPEELVYGSWPSDLKNNFCSLIREKFKDTSVKWINPVALVVFQHPESIFRSSQLSWASYRHQALFMPVAIAKDQQAQLEKAYQEILNPKVPPNEHLTPFLSEKILINDGKCFRCVKQDNNIVAYRCINNESEVVGSVANQSDYNLLFRFTSPVWFVPSPVLSTCAAQSGLYKDKSYLVGAYMGFGNSGICAGRTYSTCQNKNSTDFRIREAIEWVTQLFFLRRLKEQGNEFRKILEQYSKQMNMLRLLEAPLTKLTEALDATQEQSQHLRALLYAPSRAIFAAAPRIIKYFEERGIVSWGNLRWESVHDPTRENLNHSQQSGVKLTLAAFICEIFGRMKPFPKDGDALVSRAVDLLSANKDLSYDELKNVCLKIIGVNNNSKKRMRSNITSYFTTHEKSAAALHRFKQILYRPYKDGDYGGFTLEPLFVALFCSWRKVTVSLVTYVENIIYEQNEYQTLEAALEDKTDCYPFFVSLPVPRYSQWLALLLGIIEYVRAEKTDKDLTLKCKIEYTKNKLTSVTLDFDNEVFDKEKMKPFHQEVYKWFGKSDISYSAHGNFKKPFIDFLLVASGSVKLRDDSFCIKHKNHEGTTLETTIKAFGRIFSYTCEKNGLLK
jgi:hypothetical protein